MISISRESHFRRRCLPIRHTSVRSGPILYHLRHRANTVDGKTEARGPGSLIMNRTPSCTNGETQQRAVDILAFNINPEGVQPCFRAHQQESITNGERSPHPATVRFRTNWRIESWWQTNDRISPCSAEPAFSPPHRSASAASQDFLFDRVKASGSGQKLFCPDDPQLQSVRATSRRAVSRGCAAGATAL